MKQENDTIHASKESLDAVKAFMTDMGELMMKYDIEFSIDGASTNLLCGHFMFRFNKLLSEWKLDKDSSGMYHIVKSAVMYVYDREGEAAKDILMDTFIDNAYISPSEDDAPFIEYLIDRFIAMEKKRRNETE